MLCHSLGCEVKFCVGEADFQLCVDARKPNTYVLGRDTDFALTSGVQYIHYDYVEIVRVSFFYPLSFCHSYSSSLLLIAMYT